MTHSRGAGRGRGGLSFGILQDPSAPLCFTLSAAVLFPQVSEWIIHSRPSSPASNTSFPDLHSQPPTQSHTHTRTHTHTHTHHTHVYVYTLVYTERHTHMSHTHTHTYKHTRMHAHTHAHNVHTETHLHMYMCTHTQKHSNTYIHTQRDTCTHMCIHKHIYTYTHTPTHIQFSSVQLLIRVRLFATPWTAAHQAFLSITNYPNSCPLSW